MDSPSVAPSAGDLADEAGTLGVGLFTLIQFFPFALPAVVLVVAPLAVVAVVGLLLAGPVLLPVWPDILYERVRTGAWPDQEVAA